ncbi:hypothetical protein I6A60_00505 [Frankia sp. AgB1.9]|uniref:hypothetical protein n=1 Tax=unclassified Frankia TaxID=2632575 RepID=UPI001931DBF6|nr:MULTISPECIES: hypothetical protein [unclassified Frankia]MBL7487361.1 hypothetical protein [Frankia sp. AgW1.1]MBL7546369.1 hypothetical protein [Frankia sp. AgB1.9]MBL7618586.1 hypothetical protein [Frankia sp. AgB1.8]
MAGVREAALRRRTEGPTEEDRRAAERARRPVDKIRVAIEAADSATLRAALLAVVDNCTNADGTPMVMDGGVLEVLGVQLGTRKPRQSR